MRMGAKKTIITLDARVLLESIIRTGTGAAPLMLMHDGHFANPNTVLHTDDHAWCPLFDQLDSCLEAHGVEREKTTESLAVWFFYMDFSGLSNKIAHTDDFPTSPYGRAMETLIDQGFSIEDAHGLTWHYTVFDKSASMSRESIVSFLADTGYDRTGQPIHIYDEMSARLCLDINFEELQAAHPRLVSWNKYFMYRALYLSTAQRIPSSNKLPLTEQTVLVIDTEDAIIPCDVRRAQMTGVHEDGSAQVDFYTQSEAEGGSITLRLFDGEGLVAPGFAAHMRDALQHDTHPTSFQIRMPFAKGVVHEVDFHRFVAEALGISAEQCADLAINDAFGISRRLGDVQLILTTDMLKCHAWLQAWVELPAARAQVCPAQDVSDPMAYYFAKMREYGHALYVLPKHAAHEEGITANAQYLSTLAMDPHSFDQFASARFRAVSDALFDEEQARALILSGADTEGSDDAALFALRKDVRFIHDPHVRRQLASTVNARLVDLATGKLPVRGTLRVLSQDLLVFACLIARRAAATEQDATSFDAADASERLAALEACCLDPDELYMPHYQGPINETGWVAVFRNPHLARSEQCALRPLQVGVGSPYAAYFGHLSNVAMVSCASSAPMVLGGADYDGDRVHIYDDAALASAVLEGAYVRKEDGTFSRRFPVADLSGAASSPASNQNIDAGGIVRDDAIGRHISFSQLLRSFQSNVGILSNSALRLSTILYGHADDGPSDESQKRAHPLDDACANYTIAVGMDIDSVKTGVRLAIGDLRIEDAKKQVSQFGITGKIVPPDLGFIRFKDTWVPFLKSTSRPIWEHGQLDESIAGQVGVCMRQGGQTDFRVLNPHADPATNTMLKGASVSNIQRLPHLLIEEAERIRSLNDDTSFIVGKDAQAASPLEERSRLVALTIDERKLSAIEALVKAHHSAMGTLKERDRKVGEAKNSKAFGKARRRAQEYPTRFSSEEVDAILAKAVSDIREYLASNSGHAIEDALAAFDERGFAEWALCPAEHRKEVLHGFLPGIVFDEDFYAILEDDALANGFMIPFYLAGAALDAERSQAGIGLEVPKGAEYDSGAAENTGYDPSDDRIRRDAQMYADLVAIMNQHLSAKTPRAAMADEMRDALRERILGLLDEGDRLVDYLCVLRSSHRCFPEKYYNSRALFWELLTPDDLDGVVG